MTDPAVVQAEADLEQAKANLCEAAVTYYQTHGQRYGLYLTASKYGAAQEHYLSVLATLGDGTL